MKILPSDSSQWYIDKGDSTLRIDYPELNSKSIVVDIGARHGDWSDQIKSRYNPNIHCFDVVSEFCKELQNKGYRVYEKAVYNKRGKISIGIEDNEGSVYHNKNTFQVDSIEATDIFGIIGENSIDLMKINVEGAEYSILENLIQTGGISNIKNIQVQFHLIEKHENVYSELEKKLEKTHKLTWKYPFVWENWKLIES